MATRGKSLILVAFFLGWTGVVSTEEKAPKSPKLKVAKRPAGEEVGEALIRALEWLRRHQDEDGGWSSAGYTKRCKKPCENVDAGRYGKGLGQSGHDVGVSALATLAFVRYGRSHKEGLSPEDKECLKRASKYLLGKQVQTGDDSVRGRIGPTTNEEWIYHHALATLALAEAAGLPDSEVSKARVEEAAGFCLRAQNPGLGWRYGVKSGENDTSVTSWMVQALKAAERAKVNVPRSGLKKSMEGAVALYNRTTAASGKVGYQAAGDEGSRLNLGLDPHPWSKRMSPMTAAGVLGRLLAGESRSSRKVKDGVDLVAAELPLWDEEVPSIVSFYYWYYGTQALHQYGGAPWRTWRAALEKALVPKQRRGETDEAGSWDPVDEWGWVGGRVYSTAINALSLVELVPRK